MPYVFAALGDLGEALPSNCSQSPRAMVFGKIQEALKAKRLDIGNYGIDCKYGESTNKALGQWVATQPRGSDAAKYIAGLGLTRAEATEAAQKIAVWLAANPAQPKPFGSPPIGFGTQAGTTAGRVPGISITQVGTITTGTPGQAKPPPGTAVQPPPTPPPPPPSAEDLLPPPGPEGPAGGEAEEVWYSKYRWYLVGGSAGLVTLVLITILLASRK
jgi:hypothetical protein